MRVLSSSPTDIISTELSANLTNPRWVTQATACHSISAMERESACPILLFTFWGKIMTVQIAASWCFSWSADNMDAHSWRLGFLSGNG
ncbi:MAG: hypothetical protein JWM11_1703 [Planctomycetaceae bacterium]|nr:hypothetical protein [Planctomycetaceae bacterium]